jgi:hypothetical protein
MARVKKIELSGPQLLEALQPLLKEQLPPDAKVVASYVRGQTGAGVLIESADYNDIEGGDLVFYAPELEAALVEVVAESGAEPETNKADKK